MRETASQYKEVSYDQIAYRKVCHFYGTVDGGELHEQPCRTATVRTAGAKASSTNADCGDQRRARKAGLGSCVGRDRGEGATAGAPFVKSGAGCPAILS